MTSNENTRLLSSSPAPRVNNATRPIASSSAEPSMMNTFRSVFQIMHGIGENVRGTLLGAIDDLENNGEQKHHEVARQGRAEMDEAFQKLWGTGGSQRAHDQITPSANATGYDAAPPTYQATSAGNTAGGLGSDSKTSNGT
ncbi:hypothetical protein B0H13DRAFT_1971636 [Mycena leptocephala]|nr:hypothetical protein B0H13DRAFT_2053027 [Mycena leptocephala]KAJ7926943.1 hypothetical protein B0H13DRAFT_1971636 [Mycena leptocephala]